MTIVAHGFRVLALTALLMTPVVQPALAQMPHINMMPDLKTKSPEEKDREERAEKAYRDSMRKIPDAKTGGDPWGDVRGSEPAKQAAKPKSAPKSAAKSDKPAN